MRDSKPVSIKNMIIFIAVLLNVIVLRNGFINSDKWYWGLLITVPLLVIVIIDVRQVKKSLPLWMFRICMANKNKRIQL